jgi:hypothetical protein
MKHWTTTKPTTFRETMNKQRKGTGKRPDRKEDINRLSTEGKTPWRLAGFLVPQNWLPIPTNLNPSPWGLLPKKQPRFPGRQKQ